MSKFHKFGFRGMLGQEDSESAAADAEEGEYIEELHGDPQYDAEVDNTVGSVLGRALTRALASRMGGYSTASVPGGAPSSAGGDDSVRRGNRAGGGSVRGGPPGAGPPGEAGGGLRRAGEAPAGAGAGVGVGGSGDLGEEEEGGGGGGEGDEATTTAGDEEEGEVTLAAPEDDEPLRRFITRTLSCRKEEFEELARACGHADEALAQEEALAKAFELPTTMASCAKSRRRAGGGGGGAPAAAAGARGARRLRRAGGRRLRGAGHRSVFGLPTFDPSERLYLWWSFVILVLDMTYRRDRGNQWESAPLWCPSPSA
eukprot:scaffold7.g3502.t1